MLSCAARTEDARLRRWVGLQIVRMMRAFEEEDEVKKLVSRTLGCSDWKVGREEDGVDGDPGGGLSMLTIEELDDKDKEKEMASSIEEVIKFTTDKDLIDSVQFVCAEGNIARKNFIADIDAFCIM